MTKKTFFVLATITSRVIAFNTIPKGVPKATANILGIQRGRNQKTSRYVMIPDESLTSHSTRKSVTGIIYSTDEKDAPVVRLFTKEGCTLCDEVSEVLSSLREEIPHTLEAVDITDEENIDWYAKYKWDIPVLQIADGETSRFWAKHRLNEEEAREGLVEARTGEFSARKDEPDSSSYSE